MTPSFEPLIDKPTRITDFSSTLIDNIWTNTTNTELTAGDIVNDISDHFPLKINKLITKQKHKALFIKDSSIYLILIP
jgi:hypothetical protein